MNRAACLASLIFLLAACAPSGLRPETAQLSLIYSEKYNFDAESLTVEYPMVPIILQRFAVDKGRRIHAQLLKDGVAGKTDFLAPFPITDEQLTLVHTPGYVRETRRSGNLKLFFEFIPIRDAPVGLVQKAIVEPLRHDTGGTLLACREALRTGLALNLGGGYHHALAARGGGYCMFADVAVAIKVLQRAGRVRRVLIVDLDLHQGNGNAEIFARDESVFTYSVHGDHIYPEPKAKSHLDITIPHDIGDRVFMGIVRDNLPALIHKVNPDLIVYLAGADLHGDARDGYTNITTTGIVERDLYVIDTALRNGIPVAMVLAGGHWPGAWKVHYASIRQLIEQYPPPIRTR